MRIYHLTTPLQSWGLHPRTTIGVIAVVVLAHYWGLFGPTDWMLKLGSSLPKPEKIEYVETALFAPPAKKAPAPVQPKPTPMPPKATEPIKKTKPLPAKPKSTLSQDSIEKKPQANKAVAKQKSPKGVQSVKSIASTKTKPTTTKPVTPTDNPTENQCIVAGGSEKCFTNDATQEDIDQTQQELLKRQNQGDSSEESSDNTKNNQQEPQDNDPKKEADKSDSSATGGNVASEVAGNTDANDPNAQWLAAMRLELAKNYQPKPLIIPPPQSFDATYATEVNGVPNPDAKLYWRLGPDKQYRFELKFESWLFGKFAFISEGTIDDYGLAPNRAVNKVRKNEFSTNFNRDERQTITFSRTIDAYPLVAGAQDRNALIMQIGNYVNNHFDQLKIGDTFSFYVADSKGAAVWQIKYMDDESITYMNKTIQAKRFMRLPKESQNARSIEVWFTKETQGIPVQFKQTEPNGVVYAGKLTGFNFK